MGREARIKKARQATAPATYQVHITDREAWALAMHLVTACTVKDHADQLRTGRIFEEFCLNGIVETVFTPAGEKLGMHTFDPVQFEIATVARDTVDQVLSKTDCQMATLHSLILTPFLERLRDVKADRYVLPGTELQAKAEETAT